MAPLPNKNIHPVLALIANWLVFGILGYILIGQTKKSLLFIATVLIGYVACCIPGMVIAILGLIDVYMVADAIQKGEQVDENEYKLELLYKACKILHKDAVYKG